MLVERGGRVTGKTDVDTPEMRAARDQINAAERRLKDAMTKLALASMDWHASAGDDAQDGNLASQSQRAHETRSKHGASAAKAAVDTADKAGEGADIYDGTDDDNAANVQRVEQAVTTAMTGLRLGF
ncbi:hypothetical protein Srot_1153 [Segniliparus rotundus DSM 44985]|uniref:Uncharacterized protein n=1 Tax=Segniliparus rotundus (strain ATCC BAA-972 / CDC 1076 / CIP 108378 / DSM 44985 / JCM 13578) TaxID=640132 RepID=D6ZFA1_SEGRD|nr:hypothetical protein Srot_1153 [Segniliparus rotundus DSM 44985]